MKNQIINYIIDHPKHNAITCGSIMGFLVSLDIHQIANTIVLSIIGAASGYLATKLLEKCLNWFGLKTKKRGIK